MTVERSECASMSDALAVIAGGERTFSSSEQHHLAACLRCRVEQSRYRRMMEAMRSLREAPVGGDSRLESQILGYLDSHGRRLARRVSARAAATVGGLAAGAAATAGLIAFAARHRRTASLAS